MKNFVYMAVTLLMLAFMTACSGNDKSAANEGYDPHFDVTFSTTYNDVNVARADSAFALLDSLSASNQAYLALFYADASDKSFENSQRFLESAIKAYNAAVAKDRAAADSAFTLYGKEFRLSLEDIHTAFAANARALEGLADQPGYTVEEVESVSETPDSVRPVAGETAEVPEMTVEEAINGVN